VTTSPPIALESAFLVVREPSQQRGDIQTIRVGNGGTHIAHRHYHRAALVELVRDHGSNIAKALDGDTQTTTLAPSLDAGLERKRERTLSGGSTKILYRVGDRAGKCQLVRRLTGKRLLGARSCHVCVSRLQKLHQLFAHLRGVLVPVNRRSVLGGSPDHLVLLADDHKRAVRLTREAAAVSHLAGHDRLLSEWVIHRCAYDPRRQYRFGRNFPSTAV
jgi:hypothetical protein